MTTLTTTAATAIAFDATSSPAPQLGDQIGTLWQRLVSGQRRKHDRRQTSKPPVQTELTERETLPVIIMSPFGGYYFGQR